MTQGARARFADLIDRPLRVQIRIFLLVFAIMVVLIAVHIVQDDLNPLWVLAGFVPGLLLGLLLTRTKVLRWESSENVVVGTMDTVGIVILVAYFVFLFFRSRIIGLQVESAALVSLIGLAITAGAMFGRVYFTLRGIRNIARAAGPGAPGTHRD